MDVTSITYADFQAFFTRDFDYYLGVGCSKEFVTEDDVNKAFLEAQANFNIGLFPNQDQLKLAYLYLTAHYLCVDAQAAAQGLNSVGYALVNHRTVGSVSESYAIPDWLARDPIMSAYNTTRYGQKYLSLIRPLLIGGVTVYQGATTP